MAFLWPMSFDSSFWTQKYEAGNLGWDIGYAAPALTHYFDQLRNQQLKILIPGCGNAYEARYLMEAGFTDVHILDISPFPVEALKNAFYPQYEDRLHLYHENFFDHQGQYDLIIEQTFFCALPPEDRDAYTRKMHELLKPGGHLVGVMFTFPFSENGPPFGGDMSEYRERFAKYFQIRTLESCTNSIEPRVGNECFINLIKPAQSSA